MSQEQADSEELMGKYLSEWIEDLRAGNVPYIDEQALRELTAEELRELITMARFTKALEFPTDPLSGRSSEIKAALGTMVFNNRREQISAGRAIVDSAMNFGDCLRAARSSLQLSMEELSKDSGIPQQVLEDVEAGLRPPTRIQPVAKMLELIVILSIGLRETVDLIRETAETWTSQNFKASPTQLGRVDSQLLPYEQRRLLDYKGLNDLESETEREFVRIRQYVDELYRSIESR